MPRTKRFCPAGHVFHVLNRAVARLTVFEKPEDFEAFIRVLDETWQIVPPLIFAMVAIWKNNCRENELSQQQAAEGAKLQRAAPVQRDGRKK